MKPSTESRDQTTPRVRCAIYTRKSTDENLDSEFNTLDAQREAAEAYIASQREEGWRAIPDRYDDGGYSGGTLERPALRQLLDDVESGRIDCVVVYKLDRLSRSLLDFAKLMDIFDRQQVSFVSVTQQFNTTNSMGRLVLNVLLSFAQFEREIIAERIRDKVASARRKGKYMGGMPPLGYDVDRANRRLVVNPTEAELVQRVFRRFVQIGSTTELAKELNAQGFTTKTWTTQKGRVRPGSPWENGYLESFNGKLRDELLAREVFDTLLEAKVLIARWRSHYNRRRPHSSLGYRAPAPEAVLPRQQSPALEPMYALSMRL
jgi:site-specific DNA recombinase